MSFFDSIPAPPDPPEPVLRPRPAWERPDEVIPGSVPAELLLIRTEQVAVAIGSVRAYPNGFEFTVHTRLRKEDDTWPRPGGPMERHGRRGTPDADEALRLGIMYADGRRAATTDGHWRPEDEDEDEPELGRLMLQQGGGGGSARYWDGNFWAHPLPPQGPVTFVASWLKYGVEETCADLDGTAIQAAAQRAIVLWPQEPEYEPSAYYGWSSHSVTAAKHDDPGARTEPDRPRSEDTGPTPTA